MLGIIIILVVVIAFEIIATLLNRGIIKNKEMFSDNYMFTVHATAFSIFTSILIIFGLSYFIYLSFFGFNNLNSMLITAVIMLIIQIFELYKMITTKISINGSSIQTKRHDFSFSEITKVEVLNISFLDLISVDVFVNDKKMFSFNSEKLGYQHFIDRLKQKDTIEWLSLSGSTFDKSIL